MTETSTAPQQQQPMAKVAIWTALSNLTLPLTSLATAPILARELGATGRGEMASVVAPIFILMLLANMGLPEAVAYHVVKLRQSPHRVLAHAARLSVVYGLVTAVGVWVAAPYFLHQSPQMVPLLRAVVVLLPLMMVLQVMRGVIIGLRAYKAGAFERVLTPVLRLGSFVVLLLLDRLTVTSAVWAQMVCTVVGGSYLGLAILRHRHLPPEGGEPSYRRLTREIGVYGLRGWGGMLGNLVTWRLDQVVLVTVVAPREVGYYVVAVSFAEISGIVVNPVRNVLFAEAAHRDSPELIARSTRVMTLLVALSAGVGCLLAEPVVRLLFGADFLPAVALGQVLLVASIPFCLAQTIAAGLYAEGHPGMLSIAQVTGAVLTIGGLLVLAPHMGAMGAALASLVAYSVTCLMLVLQYRHVSGQPVRTFVLVERADLAWLGESVGRIVRKLER